VINTLQLLKKLILLRANRRNIAENERV